MREEDIRPEQLMQEAAKLLGEDAERILSLKSEFVSIPCPACESGNHKFLFDKNGFTFVTCNECETVFINPRPSFEILKEHYETSKGLAFWNKKIFPMSEDSRRVSIFAPRAEKVAELCRKHNISAKVLIDVGAGFGTFCEEIKKLRIFESVIAVEPSQSLAQTCRNKGIEVIEKTIEEVEINGVDVITNFELIEHLFWPKDFLLACKKVLPSGGLLILTTPNIKGFDLLVGGKAAQNVNGPNHINYFHPDSLSLLLEQIGFQVVEVTTPGKLDAELARKKILSGELDISNRPFLKNILIDNWQTVGSAFQQFLTDNKLSSHMWIVAKKI